MPDENGRCDWESTVVVVHDWDGGDPLERSIAEGVVDLCSADGLTCPTAEESERVETVNRLFSGTHLVSGEVSVTYAGCDVTVKSNGVVRIEGPTDGN